MRFLTGREQHVSRVRGHALCRPELVPPLDIVVTRHDVPDETAFRGSGVLDLYEELFPPNERDSGDDIVRWVLSDDVGKRRCFTVNGEAVSYRLDSRCFILRAAERAIGLGFFTYDHASRLLYCNNVGVQTKWRGGSLARAFYLEMVGMLDELFPHNIGVVLEVEYFDRDRLEAIIGDLERGGERRMTANDQVEIRKFLRVSWYRKLDHAFFVDVRTKQPMLCRSPCLDPALPPSVWAGAEEDYWLMWHPRAGAATGVSGAGVLWRTAVETLYVEILAKSLVAADPDGRRAYWDYATTRVAGMLRQAATVPVTFASYPEPAGNSLLSRWRQLAIDLPI
ncbi:hypothetical protein [Bradyrhizobium lablabi]|uniref:hypothetical protein n=1 Tax=Bradyrhizobium lablabi TaxID=722472 RepID=UPI001BA664A5|nr:hypothetical protein [Bradyrhizobium lablabi]MBR0697209.1 hypothetical protein [Bradyrhizobium lablabi]